MKQKLPKILSTQNNQCECFAVFSMIFIVSYLYSWRRKGRREGMRERETDREWQSTQSIVLIGLNVASFPSLMSVAACHYFRKVWLSLTWLHLSNVFLISLIVTLLNNITCTNFSIHVCTYEFRHCPPAYKNLK